MDGLEDCQWILVVWMVSLVVMNLYPEQLVLEHCQESVVDLMDCHGIVVAWMDSPVVKDWSHSPCWKCSWILE